MGRIFFLEKGIKRACQYMFKYFCLVSVNFTTREIMQNLTKCMDFTQF